MRCLAGTRRLLSCVLGGSRISYGLPIIRALRLCEVRFEFARPRGDGCADPVIECGRLESRKSPPVKMSTDSRDSLEASLN